MPRTGILLSLSREHHSALVLARAASRTAESGDVMAQAEMIGRIETYWTTVMAEHFELEERLIAQIGRDLDAQSVMQVLSEHAELRLLVKPEYKIEPADRLRRFGEVLYAHVRFEERHFFPQLQIHPGLASNLSADPTHSDN